MLYKVTRSYQRGGAETVLNTFKTFSEGCEFIQEKLLSDSLLKVNTYYRIYEGMDLMEEFDQSKLQKKESDEREEESGTKSGKGVTFSPTPFNMKPQPKGVPQPWVKDEEDNEKKE